MAEDIDILKDIPPKLRPPLVRVAGQFQNDGAGTFVIHVIESVPPPSTPVPQDWPIRVPAFLRDGIYIPMLAGPAFGPMLDANMRTEFAGTPTTSREFLPNRLMTWRVVFRRSRGRRKGSGRFKDAEDFRQTVVCDLRHLLDNGLKATQEELAGLWYDRDNNPTAEADSLVAEIKRYCKTYKYRWEDLADEAGRR